MRWYQRFFRRNLTEKHLDAELRFHLEQRIADLVTEGMAPGEARRRARLEFGGLDQLKEECRDVGATQIIETLIQDIRYGLRQLRRSPGFTTVAVITLALGIGLNTAIFSLVNTVLLRPLPYPNSQRILIFMRTGEGFEDANASPATFNAWRQLTEVFEDVSAFRFSEFDLKDGAYSERIRYGQVSANFFELFGASLIAGRTFSRAQDLPGAERVAVLSNETWRRRFHGDVDVIGKIITLGGHPYVVIGILGPSFSTADFWSGWGQKRAPQVWIPFQLEPNSLDANEYFRVAGRLRPGVTLGIAKGRLQAAAEEFRRKNPTNVLMGSRRSFGVEPMQAFLVKEVGSTLLLLSGAVGFVLLIACANVANLLLARAAGRRQEVAVRAAIGAGQGRIVRQLLTESVVLAVASGALGVVIGYVGIHTVLKIAPVDIPRIGLRGSALTMDWRVLSFTFLASLTTAMLFGLVPSVQGSRCDVITTLKDGGAYLGASARQNKARSLLVVGETALALILLVGAGLMVRTFVAMHSVDLGLDSHNVLTVLTGLRGSRFQKASGVAEVVGTSIQRINALPGVVDTAFTCCLPLEGELIGSINVVGRAPDSHTSVEVSTVSAGYFRVFKVPVLRGRTFTDDDSSGAAPVVVINRTLARRLWPHGEPGQDPLAQQVRLLDTPDLPPWHIVGIVGDVRASRLDGEPPAILYIPVAQTPEDVNAYLLREPVAWIVRTRGSPYLASLPVQNVLRQATDGSPVLGVRSMDDIVAESAGGRNFSLVLMTIFACSAILLAGIGVYGVVAYSVKQRTKEFGIRAVMGAQGTDILQLAVREAMILALMGVGIGLTGALGLTRLLSSWLFGVKPTDPVTFVAVSLILTVVVVLACYIPARRATKVDPMTALRYE
jgi:putative ABC transport system permease protein